ncbi:integral membrane protein [Colletotrichum tofieldiae]|uniref:Integral membrane protein n=1 Tax=Colletotrichum tofieldiae TaxID=708197 RepID=A0A166QK67_9PEZI|nr:integral membrane protein [Colletotrichum tofieldiae]GKT61394.1 integral membrane protein [Colletotrichum tofieldiae]GKT69054.1 integral membrane protein [Colletotrichum tofieldiae]GKT96920.1 integral membrane protein [Colletotrichum tofieldiae]
MPQTELKQSLDLSIQLHDPQPLLYGGSIILGHVVRKSSIVTPLATVLVRLLGRAKAEVTINEGEYGSRQCRSCFNFWPDSAITEVIHEGPIQVAPSGSENQSWAFTLALPTHTDARSFDSFLGDSERKACFLYPGGKVDSAAGIPEQLLPGSFFFGHDSGKEFHGLVEYWIEAELVVQGKGSIAKATLPIKVAVPPTLAPPISDFGLVKREMSGSVSSQRLLPGMECAELTFKQKTQKLFGSSKVPKFHYTLNVQYPTIIQMGSNASIPFLLHISPDKESTTSVIKDVPQTVTINNMQLELHSITGIRCPGTPEPEEASKTHKALLATISSLYPANAQNIVNVVLPSGPEEEPLDLGAVLDLRLDDLGRVLHGTTMWRDYLGIKILPTFVSYCVRVEHLLRWDVCLSVAGETWKCGGIQKILVLRP